MDSVDFTNRSNLMVAIKPNDDNPFRWVYLPAAHEFTAYTKKIIETDTTQYVVHVDVNTKMLDKILTLHWQSGENNVIESCNALQVIELFKAIDILGITPASKYFKEIATLGERTLEHFAGHSNVSMKNFRGYANKFRLNINHPSHIIRILEEFLPLIFDKDLD